MTILYDIQDSLYVNITNKCPCSCVFCIRKESDSIGGNDSLWLEHEPSVEEIIEEFKKTDLSKYKEIVFCGYGEPLERIDVLIEICKYIRSISKIKTRINTNGLSDLMHNKPTAKMLKGYIDSISISLNAPTNQSYLDVTKSKYGIKSFDAMLDFAKECKKYIPDVMFSVVDVISKEEIDECKKISKQMQIPLRVRTKI